MSHAPERKERNCLNCGATVMGRYCHICGQENIEPKESLWQLIAHFFNDITHFDGKFFTTLKDLLSRPGFLSREYMVGRRASYLNPVRMYVFTSAIFFLIFFSFLGGNEGGQSTITINGKILSEIDGMDSTSFAAFTTNINQEGGKPAVPMTRAEFRKYMDTAFNSGIHFGGIGYKSRKEYDSALASGKKNNWLQRQLTYKQIQINEKYKNNSQEIVKAIGKALLHRLPQMLFISLPFLALILKLIYIRRKQFYYVSHTIFSIHLYIFLFIAMLILFGISKFNSQVHWGALTFVSVILTLGLFVYEYLALKNFYRQGWIKTFIKFILFNIFSVVIMGILMVFFLIFSVFEI